MKEETLPSAWDLRVNPGISPDWLYDPWEPPCLLHQNGNIGMALRGPMISWLRTSNLPGSLGYHYLELSLIASSMPESESQLYRTLTEATPSQPQLQPDHRGQPVMDRGLLQERT